MSALDPRLREQIAALAALSCLGEDTGKAVEAANLLGEWVAHQTSLYPVSAPAVSVLVALLQVAGVAAPVRVELAGWLGVLRAGAADVPEVGDADALAAAQVAELDDLALALYSRPEWQARAASGIRHAREVQEWWLPAG